MTACTSFDVDLEVDALDDLGAVLQRDVEVLELQHCHSISLSPLEIAGLSPRTDQLQQV